MTSFSSRSALAVVSLGLAAAAITVVALGLFVFEFNTAPSPVSAFDRLQRQAAVTAGVLAAVERVNAIRAAGIIVGLALGVATGSVIVYRREKI